MTLNALTSRTIHPSLGSLWCSNIAQPTRPRGNGDREFVRMVFGSACVSTKIGMETKFFRGIALAVVFGGVEASITAAMVRDTLKELQSAIFH
ncbi:hypothetical protein V6N13_019831 [Hibiscus sabdariffa]|uniref:Uncharacterized protein n=1 Tax=Hibiscus sabdariffa TaxID=183260 RepID=A0ABR2ETH0_9ROSI